MQRLKNKASRVFKKEEDEEVESSRRSTSVVAPWDEPPVEQSPPKRNALVRKLSALTLRKDVVHAKESAPPVPKIPDKYKHIPFSTPYSANPLEYTPATLSTHSPPPAFHQPFWPPLSQHKQSKHHTSSTNFLGAFAKNKQPVFQPPPPGKYVHWHERHTSTGTIMPAIPHTESPTAPTSSPKSSMSKRKSRDKKPSSIPRSPSGYSLSTVTPYTFHEHTVVPPIPGTNPGAASSEKAGTSSKRTTPTSPPSAPRVASTSSTASTFSLRRSSTGRPSSTAIRPRKSLRDLFKRSNSAAAAQDIGRISRPHLVAQPSPDAAVPPLPTVVAFKKPSGPPPRRPARDGTVDLDVVATRLVLPAQKSGLGEEWEQYRRSREGRYVVEGTGVRHPVQTERRGMVLRDRMTGERIWVPDL